MLGSVFSVPRFDYVGFHQTERLNQDIKQVLREQGWDEFRPVQGVLLPSMSRNSSLVCIAPRKFGKLSICTLFVVSKLLSNDDGQQSEREFNNGPLAIIIVPDWERCEVIWKFCERLRGQRPLKIIWLDGGPGDIKWTVKLLNGCDLLITTPLALLSVLRTSPIPNLFIHLRQIRYAIFDSLDVLLNCFGSDTESILSELSASQKQNDLDLNIFALFNRYDSFSRPFMQKMDAFMPNLVIAPYREVSVRFPLVSTGLILCSEQKKLDIVCVQLQTLYQAGRRVIVCVRLPKIGLSLQRRLEQNFDVLATVYTLDSHQQLNSLVTVWRLPATAPKRLAIICDEVLSRMEVPNQLHVDLLLHYDLGDFGRLSATEPSAFDRRLPWIFTTPLYARFARNSMASTINMLNEHQQMICVTERDHDSAIRFGAYVDRLQSTVGKVYGDAQKLLHNGLRRNQEASLNSFLPLCSQMLRFGRCWRDRVECGFHRRHVLNKDVDRPLAPVKGELLLRLTRVTEATQFEAVIEQILDASIESQTMLSAMQDKLTQHLTTEQAMPVRFDDAEPYKLYGVKFKGVPHRVQIYKVSPTQKALVAVDLWHRDRKGGLKIKDPAKLQRIELFDLNDELRNAPALAVQVVLSALKPSHYQPKFWSVLQRKVLGKWDQICYPDKRKKTSDDDEASWEPGEDKISKVEDAGSCTVLLRVRVQLCLGRTIWVQPLLFVERLRSGTLVTRCNVGDLLLKIDCVQYNPEHVSLLASAARKVGLLASDTTPDTDDVEVTQLRLELLKVNKAEKQTTSIATRRAFLPLDLREVQVYLSMVDTPANIYVQRVDCQQSLRSLERDIGIATISGKLTKAKLESVRTGAHYVVQSDGRWQRVTVQCVELHEQLLVDVMFEDYGDCAHRMLPVTDLFNCPSEFIDRLPLQAIPARLANIASWSVDQNVSNLLWTLTHDEMDYPHVLNARVVYHDELLGQYVLTLARARNGKDIGELLVEAGVADFDVYSIKDVVNDLTLTEGCSVRLDTALHYLLLGVCGRRLRVRNGGFLLDTLCPRLTVLYAQLESAQSFRLLCALLLELVQAYGKDASDGFASCMDFNDLPLFMRTECEDDVQDIYTYLFGFYAVLVEQSLDGARQFSSSAVMQTVLWEMLRNTHDCDALLCSLFRILTVIAQHLPQDNLFSCYDLCCKHMMAACSSALLHSIIQALQAMQVALKGFIVAQWFVPFPWEEYFIALQVVLTKTANAADAGVLLALLVEQLDTFGPCPPPLATSLNTLANMWCIEDAKLEATCEQLRFRAAEMCEDGLPATTALKDHVDATEGAEDSLPEAPQLVKSAETLRYAPVLWGQSDDLVKLLIAVQDMATYHGEITENELSMSVKTTDGCSLVAYVPLHECVEPEACMVRQIALGIRIDLKKRIAGEWTALSIQKLHYVKYNADWMDNEQEIESDITRVLLGLGFIEGLNSAIDTKDAVVVSEDHDDDDDDDECMYNYAGI